MSKSSSERITSALRDFHSGKNISSPRKLTKRKSSKDISTKLTENSPPAKKRLSDDWLHVFAPKKVEDLAVHANKIQEVEKWLDGEPAKMKNPLLLLTGPAGCGKTAVVKVLAEQKNFEVCEWISPEDTCKQYRDADDEGMEIRETQSEKFREFLFKASRYKSLFAKSNKRLILVEDFPNFLLRDNQIFLSILDSWKIYGKCPLIFIATETKSKELNISVNLFPDSVRSTYGISSISFNPISATLMKKALLRITNALKQEEYSKIYKQPAQEVVEGITSSAMGDIRNAILNLQFVSQRDATVKINIEATKAPKKSKGKSSKSSSGTTKRLKTVGRDETITLMHAMGRVFNPKYEDGVLTHNPEELAEDFSTQPHNFIAFIHANYLQHGGNVEDCAEIAENLSFSEYLSREWRCDDIPVMALIVATRGTMVLNATPVSGWIPCRGPRKINPISSHEQHEKIFNLGYEGFHSMATTAADLIQYATIIGKDQETIRRELKEADYDEIVIV
ncbi:cell cycle checkpoint protein RAD17 [Lutzomyia longipalpis]|uniref:cell cycle checkpoint protein RAD17 n=1 Tax=Lutzomyia longipalpis TaxID=7200 RepID=UPI0024844E6F|nr:cell cycle checkpoint protein RAD17 [Lutzomyia longipalpis]